MDKLNKKAIKQIEEANDIDFSNVSEEVVRMWITDGVYDEDSEILVREFGRNLPPEGILILN